MIQIYMGQDLSVCGRYTVADSEWLCFDNTIKLICGYRDIWSRVGGYMQIRAGEF